MYLFLSSSLNKHSIFNTEWPQYHTHIHLAGVYTEASFADTWAYNHIDSNVK